MNLGLSTVGANAAKDAAQRIGPVLGGLDTHGLAHDGAPASEDLEIGHGSSAGRDMASGGKGSKSGGGGLVEEGTHGAGLPKKRFHIDSRMVEWWNGKMNICLYN